MSAAGWAMVATMAVSSLDSYQNARQAAAIDKKMKEFTNLAGKIDNAINTNVLVEQSSMVQKQALQDRINIGASTTKYKAALDLQIAAAEIGGNSVTLQENDILRKADAALVNNMEAEDAAIDSIKSEKRNLDFNTIVGQNYSIIRQPSAFTALMGAGASGYQGYLAVDGKYQTQQPVRKEPTKTQP